MDWYHNTRKWNINFYAFVKHFFQISVFKEKIGTDCEKNILYQIPCFVPYLPYDWIQIYH